MVKRLISGIIAVLGFILIISFFRACTSTRYNDFSNPAIWQTFSDEFLDTFLDDYSVRDPNLQYYTAEEYGGYITRSDVADKYGMERSDYDLRISKLSNVDEKQFVMGARCDYGVSFFGGKKDSFYVYSHKDAPDPLMDWTVSNIEIYHISKDFEQETEEYQKGLGNLLNENDIVFSWKDTGKSEALLEDIKNSARGANDMRSGEEILDVYNNNKYDYGKFVLVIRFEESENIFWGSEIRVVGNNFSIKHYNDDVSSLRAEPIYSHLGQHAAEVLENIFPTIAELDPERIDLPQSSDFSNVVAEMSYEDVVAAVGSPQRIMTDTSKIYSGCSFAVEYDTADSQIYTIAFKRTNSGALIAKDIKPYRPYD